MQILLLKSLTNGDKRHSEGILSDMRIQAKIIVHFQLIKSEILKSKIFTSENSFHLTSKLTYCTKVTLNDIPFLSKLGQKYHYSRIFIQ